MGQPRHAVRYANLREKRTAFASRHICEVNEKINQVDEMLAEHAAVLGGPLYLSDKSRLDLLQKIKILQRGKEELLAEISHYDDVILTETPTRNDLLQEFYKIISIPSVYSVSVGGVMLVLNIEARTEIDGQRYNLGDWSLSLDLSRDEIKTSQIRSGLRGDAEERGRYTGIQYSWSFGFCFGDNLELVRSLLNQADYVAAIRVAVAYMNDVNENHKLHASSIYKRAS